MRTLFVTRGAPATGKTTLLKRLGLGDHVLSADAARDFLAGPAIGPGGSLARRTDMDARAWRMVMESLEGRMERGETVAVDGMHIRTRDLRNYLNMARRHRYRTVVVDFRNADVEKAVLRDAERRSHDRVGEGIVRRKHDEVRRSAGPDPLAEDSDVDVVFPEDPELPYKLPDIPVEDFSGYARVVHVADLQGCLSPLLDPRSPFSDAPRADTMYVVAGDLLDRGVENGDVVRWVLDNLAGRDNVRLVRGNHDEHIERWLHGHSHVSREFEERTLPQLEAAGLSPDDVRPIVDRFRDILLYRFGDERVMVTHAGLPTVPDAPALVPSSQYVKGVGTYDAPVDRWFDAAAPAGWVQVRGHRNPQGLPVHAGERSFCLEDDVEHGGNMRFAVLSSSGWETVEVPNAVFRPARERADKPGARRPVPWLDRPDDGGTVMPADELAALRASDLVSEIPLEGRPHVSAIKAKRKAFQKGLWDERVNRARGLFVNNRTGEVVARYRDKFPNVGERTDSTLDAICEGAMTFPLRAWVKENGFLGLVGYDSDRDELTVMSKSQEDGPYADAFRGMLHARSGGRALEDARRRLRDAEACLAFEVVDPVGDPHLIDYADPQLVLLDVVRRSPRLELAPFEEKFRRGEKREGIESWARALGVRPKEPGPRLSSPQHLRGWLRDVERFDHRHHFRDGSRAPVEGYVLEDAEGRAVKVKLPYYRFWKSMRSVKDRILRIRGTDRPLQRDVSDPAAAAFAEWCREQPDDVLALGIPSLRARFLRERPDAPRPRMSSVAEAKPSASA